MDKKSSGKEEKTDSNAQTGFVDELEQLYNRECSIRCRIARRRREGSAPDSTVIQSLSRELHAVRRQIEDLEAAARQQQEQQPVAPRPDNVSHDEMEQALANLHHNVATGVAQINESVLREIRTDLFNDNLSRTAQANRRAQVNRWLTRLHRRQHLMEMGLLALDGVAVADNVPRATRNLRRELVNFSQRYQDQLATARDLVRQFLGLLDLIERDWLAPPNFESMKEGTSPKRKRQE